MTIKMNKRVKAKWLKALRSGKYKQGKNVLNKVDSYCCLGVLCDLHSREKLHRPAFSKDNTYKGQTCVLPLEVVKWAGLPNPNPIVVADDSLAQMNDHGFSFEHIANIIEQTL